MRPGWTPNFRTETLAAKKTIKGLLIIAALAPRVDRRAEIREVGAEKKREELLSLRLVLEPRLLPRERMIKQLRCFMLGSWRSRDPTATSVSASAYGQPLRPLTNGSP